MITSSQAEAQLKPLMDGKLMSNYDFGRNMPDADSLIKAIGRIADEHIEPHVDSVRKIWRLIHAYRSPSCNANHVSWYIELLKECERSLEDMD